MTCKEATCKEATCKEVHERLIGKEMEILAAQKRRDFSAVEALLADEFHEIGGSGRLFSKPEVMEALPEMEVLDYSFEDFKVLPAGAGHAIVVYIATVERVYKGQAQSSRAYRSSTWAERDGVWRAIFHQATPLPMPSCGSPSNKPDEPPVDAYPER